MRSAAAMLTIGLLTACSGAPDIGKDLPSEYAQAEPIFDARVKTRFPVGTLEAEVFRVLEEQGFVRSADAGGVTSVTFTKNELVMKTIWSVRWHAANGRITEIWGVHGAVAP